MPIYPFHCPSCGRDQDQFARVDDRDANPPTCCGAAMSRQITAPMVAVANLEGYQCPMTGEVVTSSRRRKYLMEANGVVDAREYAGKDGPWARKRAKDAAEKAEVEAEIAALPDEVKKAAGLTGAVAA